MDEAYDPKHKASSVTSTTSTSTNGTVPSLFSGTSSVGGGDLDDFGAFEALDPTASLSIPADDDYYFLSKQDGQQTQQTTTTTTTTQPPPAHDILDTFFDVQSLDVAPPSRKRRTSVVSQDSQTDAELPQDKRTRDLLTDEERRANHIASEQKRRNTIRNGFKELTDIIPTLKNINNSKSTILFKAVEYVRHLDKRNRGLRDKLASLQLRLEVESRLGRRPHHTATSGSAEQQRGSAMPTRTTTTAPSTTTLAPETLAALMAHKKQQQQLEMLQEQLRMQQELLAKHNIAYPSSTSHINIPSSSAHTFSTPYASLRRHSALPASVHAQQQQQQQQQHLALHRHGSIDAPSLNIPADEEFNTEHQRRELLLSCHRNYQPSRSTSLT